MHPLIKKAKTALNDLLSAVKKLPDKISEVTGYVATRVPLSRASGPNEVTLDVPGYAQLDTYCCGVVAGVMVVKYFRPRASFSQFHDRVDPKPEWGASTAKIARALRESGVRVKVRSGLAFADLRGAIDAGSPVIVSVQNPSAETGHWVVVYGYGRNPNRVFVATNGLPLFTRNAIPLQKFARIWRPRGNGLICDYPKRLSRRACRAVKHT